MCSGDKSQVSGGGARDLPDCAEAIRVPSWQGCHRRPACTRGRRWRGTKTLRPEAKPASLPACDMPRRPHKREAGSGKPCCLSHSESSRRGEPGPGTSFPPACGPQGLPAWTKAWSSRSFQVGRSLTSAGSACRRVFRWMSDKRIHTGKKPSRVASVGKPLCIAPRSRSPCSSTAARSPLRVRSAALPSARAPASLSTSRATPGRSGMPARSARRLQH